MTVFAAAALVTLILFILTGFSATLEGKTRWKINKKQLLSPLGLLIILFGVVTVIPANNVGIVYSPFHGVSEGTLPEGIHYKTPFDTVYKLSTEVQSQQLSNLSGQTKDAQYLNMEVDVKYRVDSPNAFEIFKQFRTLDNMSRSFIAPTVQRSIESVTTQYNIIEVLGEERNQVYLNIEQDLEQRFGEAGVSFYSITFVDTDAGSEIEQAIRAEAIAKKAVETAEQERLKTQIEAQRRVIEAQADQEKARVEAETKVIEAQGQAEANRTLAASITPELLAQMELEARQKHGWVTVQGGNIITDTRDEGPSGSSYASQVASAPRSSAYEGEATPWEEDNQ